MTQSEQKNQGTSNTDIIRVVIVPFSQRTLNEAFANAFNQAGFKVADTAQISHNLLNHQLFNNTLRKVIELASKKTVNVYSALTEHEIQDFRNNTLHSDLILVFQIKSKTITKSRGRGTISLKGEMLAFNLKSGQLVLQCPADFKTDFFDEAEGTTYATKKLAEELAICLSVRLK